MLERKSTSLPAVQHKGVSIILGKPPCLDVSTHDCYASDINTTWTRAHITVLTPLYLRLIISL